MRCLTEKVTQHHSVRQAAKAYDSSETKTLIDGSTKERTRECCASRGFVRVAMQSVFDWSRVLRDYQKSQRPD